MKQRPDDADRQRAAHAENHIADLTDGVIGQELFHVLLDERHRHADEQGSRADDHHKRADRGAGLYVIDLRHDTNREPDAENFFKRSGEQREKGTLRVFRRERNPAVKWYRARLAKRAEQHQYTAGRADAFDWQTRDRGNIALSGYVNRDDHAKHKHEVGNAADPEHLDRGARLLQVANQQ